MKKCIKCGAVKPIHEFGVYNKNRDGRNNVCKNCRNTNAKIRRLIIRSKIQQAPKFKIGDYVVASGSVGNATFLIRDIHFSKVSCYVFSTGQALPTFLQNQLRKASKFEEIIYRFFKWLTSLKG